MEASRKATRVTNKQKKKGAIALDAELWGTLQHHVSLQTVYEKLSPDALFRLRLVCKSWNHCALQRLLPKPSFVLITEGCMSYFGPRRYLNGIVTYNVGSRRFHFKRHRFPLSRFQNIGGVDHVPPFETEGLILCHDGTQRGVFNVHTQTWHVIPPPPSPGSKSLSACGLMVDTSLKPYTFKLIEGNLDISTKIYDSKTRLWSTTSSRLLPEAKKFISALFQYTCICNNGHVYISSGSLFRGSGFMILKYSMEEDLWTTLKFPKVKWYCENSPEPENSLGVWEGRIFTTRENLNKERVTVWELVDSEKQVWEEYAHTNKEEYKWLLDCDFVNNGPRIYEDMTLRSFFRDGYLLVAMWRCDAGRADALVMFNIATKEWQQVPLRMGTVAIKSQTPGELTSSGSDDDGRENVEDEVDINDDSADGKDYEDVEDEVDTDDADDDEDDEDDED